jgi:protein phosphatase
MASLYLDLHDQFEVHALPQIHDAWRHSGLDILLLEDRSNLPLLVDLWCDQETLLLQILHWLHEMTELWAMLESQHCTQSLLQLPNLRVDEDHLLCLQRLYPDLPDQPATLSQLGQLWQKLFQQAQRTHNAELSHLCTDLEAGTIDSVAQLRSRIEAIATALQFDHLMTSALPSPENSSVEATPAAGETDAMETIQQPSSSLPEQIVEPVEDEETGFDDLPTVVLAMQLSSLEDAGRTDIGRQRDHNEDCFSVQTEIKKLENPQGRTLQAKGLYILCDGMGGHASGEVASALAVATLQRYFAEHWQDKLPSEEAIRDAIQQANQAIFDQNQKNASAGSGRMGTTLVLLLIHDAQAAIAHVGDSRLYQLTRRRGLQQLTLDHEVGQREIQRGVEPSLAYARPDAYQLTQALGPRDENFLSPDIRFIELNEDSVLLLCSDGLSDSDLLESHWQTHLEPLLDQRLNLEQGVNQLIELANQYNGHDNITAIAVRLKVRPNLDQYSRTVV